MVALKARIVYASVCSCWIPKLVYILWILYPIVWIENCIDRKKWVSSISRYLFTLYSCKFVNLSSTVTCTAHPPTKEILSMHAVLTLFFCCTKYLKFYITNTSSMLAYNQWKNNIILMHYLLVNSKVFNSNDIS